MWPSFGSANGRRAQIVSDSTLTDETPFQRLTDLARLVHREVVVLLVLCAIAFAAIAGTQAAAASARARRIEDAALLHARGRASLAAGATTAAVETLRRAAVDQPDLWRYGRSLAEALTADGQEDAARHVLLVWRDRRPEDPEVNSQLARLAARHGDPEEAQRYYESALYGIWPQDGASGRRTLGLEVIEYLLEQGRRGRALSHLLALSSNQSDDAPSHFAVARLFLEAGDARRALEHFTRALELDPERGDARAGAGRAAFALRDYARTRALLQGADDPDSVALRTTATQVLASDPLLTGLGLTERRRRLLSGLAYVREQISACLGAGRAGGEAVARLASVADALTAMEPSLALSKLRDTPETIDRGVQLIVDALSLTAATCPPAGPLDDALLRAAARHGVGEP